MRGRIVFVNPATLSGLIFGVDRERYTFPLDEWTEGGVPDRNIEVSFRTQGGAALKVKPFSYDDPMVGELAEPDDDRSSEPAFDPLAELMAEAAAAPASAGSKRKKAKIAPIVDDAPAQPELNTAAEEEAAFTGSTFAEEESPAAEDYTLNERLLRYDSPAGSQPGGPSTVPPASVLFAQDGAASRRPAWRYYAFGLGAALIFMLLAFIVTKIMH